MLLPFLLQINVKKINQAVKALQERVDVQQEGNLNGFAGAHQVTRNGKWSLSGDMA